MRTKLWSRRSKVVAGIHSGLDSAARDLVTALRYRNLMSIAVGLSAPLGERASMIAMPTRENDILCALSDVQLGARLG